MARVNILSAGPSLTQTWDPMTHGITLAVNSALLRVTADWLVSADDCTITRLGDARPRLGVWSIDDTIHKIPHFHPSWAPLRWMDFRRLPGITELPRPWQWSIQGALAAAAYHGATEVHIYGMDHAAGATDCGGYGDTDRSEDRFRREANDVAMSLQWLNARGITTTIHRPGG